MGTWKKYTRYRRKRGRTPVAAGIILLAAAVCLAVARFMPESAAELYYRAEKQNFDRILNMVDEEYSSFMSRQRPYLENAHRRRLEITASLGSGKGASGLAVNEGLREIIEGSKIVADTEFSPDEKTSASEISLLVRKTPFIDVDLYTKEDRIYFTIPVLMPGKYFSADTGRLDEIYDKLSVPVKPERIFNGAEVARALEFDRASFAESARNLAGIFRKYIGRDSVRYGGERELAISGNTFKGKEVIVSLDETAATSLIRELASAIAKDELLLEYTYGNLADLSELLNDSGLFGLLDYLDETGAVSRDNGAKEFAENLYLEKDTRSFAKALVERAGRCRPEGGVNMALVIDPDGNILERKLTLEIREEATAGAQKRYTLQICTGSSNAAFDDARNRFIDIIFIEHGASVEKGASEGQRSIGAGARATGDSGEWDGIGADGHGGIIEGRQASAGMEDNAAAGEHAVSSTTTELHIRPSFDRRGGNGTKGTVSIRYSVVRDGAAAEGIDIDADIDEKTDEPTQKKNTVARIKARIYGDAGEGTVDAEIDGYTWENRKLGSRNFNSRIDIEANLPFLGMEGFYAGLYLAGEDRFDIGQVVLPDFQKENVVDLNAATEKEIDRIKLEAAASFGEFYLTNKEFFDALLGE